MHYDHVRYAGFWGRLFGDVVLVDGEGEKAGFFRRILRHLCGLIPFLVVGLGAWLWAIHIEGYAGTLIDSFHKMQKLNEDVPAPSSGADNFHLALFISFFLFTPYFLFALAAWHAPVLFSKTKRSVSDRLAGTFVIYKNQYSFSWKPFLLKSPVTFLSVFGVIILTLASAWIVCSAYDRPLNPEAATFFHADPFNFDNNFFVAWAGLYAPAGEQNAYAYGRKVASKEIKPDADNELRFKGDTDHLCYAQDWLKEKKDCLTETAIDNLLRSNRELVSRYRALSRQTYKTYSVGDKFAIPGAYGRDVMKLQQLLAAQWVAEAQTGKGKDAIEEWLASTESQKRVLQGKSDFLNNAIWNIAYGTNLQVLPVILDSDPSLIPLYKDKITTILDYDYMEAWNVGDAMRASFNWQYTFMAVGHSNPVFKPNDAQNKFLELSEDMIELSRQPVQNLPAAYTRMENKYNCFYSVTGFAGCLAYDVVPNFLLDGMAKGGQLFQNAYTRTAQQRALILWINAKSQKIPSAGMSAFLSHAAPSLYDPFTDKPFQWDPGKNSIYFEWDGIRKDLYY